MIDTMTAAEALAELRAVDPTARLWRGTHETRLYYAGGTISTLRRYDEEFRCDAVWHAMHRVVTGEQTPAPRWLRNVEPIGCRAVEWKAPETQNARWYGGRRR